MKRQRSRNRGGGNGGKPQQNANRAFESNGPEGVKIRGAAQHVFEKYQQLARDALTAGDRVLAEGYQQHAEHYFRLLRAMQPNRPASDIIGRDAFVSGYDLDFEDESGGEATNGQDVSDNDGQDNQWRQQDNNRYENRDRYQNERGNQNDRGNDRPRDDRPRDDRPRDDRARDDRPRDDKPRDDRPQNRDRNFNRDDRPRDDRPRDDRPRDDRPKDDRSRDDRPNRDRNFNRDDRPREDRARDDRPKEDRPRDDRPRDDRPREDRPRADRFDRQDRGERADPLAVVEPRATPLTSNAEPSSSPVLRSHDGDVSHAPAFLKSQPRSEQPAEVEAAAPKPRKPRAPRATKGEAAVVPSEEA